MPAKINDCTLYHGDCLDVLPELPKAAICIADPPYSSGGLMRSDRNRCVLDKYVGESERNYAAFSGDNRDPLYIGAPGG